MSNVPLCPSIASTPRGSSWFALRVRSNFEKTVASELRERGYQELLPLYRARRRWSDRMKEIELPLFPGYVFTRLDDPARLWPVLSVRGVVHLVCAGRTPVPVDEAEIEAVSAIVRSGVPAGPWPYLRSGDVVTITDGALAGLTGILVQIKNQYRLVVSVSMLMRSVAVELDRAWVRPHSQGFDAREDVAVRRVPA